MFEFCQEQQFKFHFKETNIPYTFEFFIKGVRGKYEFLKY